MCGIIGMFGGIEKEKLDSIKYYWHLLEHRGKDSYGIVGINLEKKKVYTEKAIELEQIGFASFSKYLDFVLGHNRKSSIGSKDDINLAHPVYVKGIFTGWDILVIHNGTAREVKNVLSIAASSDTQAYGFLYDILEGKTDKMEIFLESVNVGVLFIVNISNKEMVVYKDNLRTLFINKDDKVVASEPLYSGEWWKIKDIPISILPIDKMLFENFVGKCSIEEKKVWNIEEVSKRCPACYTEKFLFVKEDKHNRCVKCVVDEKEPTKYYSGGRAYYGNISWYKKK